MRGGGWRRHVVLPAIAAALALTGCAAPVEPGVGAPRPESSATVGTDPASRTPGDEAAPWAALVPPATRQVVRTVSSTRWCRRVHCTVTQAWVRRDGRWALVREFRSSIGPGGWGKRRQDDGRTPEGVFEIRTTFSTTPQNPGRMPWRRRLPTSNVTDEAGPFYNTWLEEPDRTDGDRPSMRWGFVVDFNNVRLAPGVGPAPVPRAGSGIFYHTSRPGHRWEPSAGCTRVGDPADMRWLLTWLRPDAHPRVVQKL
ncbi:L,D-transpeptidase family protein [Nocardioides sp. SYSU DS0651]|uniref:L,D-transpeptidase family protein n=1 Tax=Nocardioides sp. SYSU DS0651 TaxID=3415955 RepID=UPI003F4BEA06